MPKALHIRVEQLKTEKKRNNPLRLLRFYKLSVINYTIKPLHDPRKNRRECQLR